MANKRTLKKNINYVCSELLAECIATSALHNNETSVDTKALLYSIISTHNDFIRRISHPQPGMKQKEYFKIIIEDFNKHVCEIIDQIVAIG
ncbi:MAG: hypothetical protein IJ421_04605 [Prevotella sp.]|nr:hypothetical protein [Prevotella sp.]MBQ4631828.1 hypothetical protein [Prevotella sp.]MBQ8628739.1 hypothetical protein [Prevotella sp.]